MYLSTIGYHPNSLLDTYNSAFILKLSHLWIENISSEVPSGEFLLSPDIHSLLLALVRPWNPDKNLYIKTLQEEYTKFLLWRGITFIKSEEIIPWTSIALTTDFYNPDIDKHAHPNHIRDNIWVTFGIKAPEDWRALFAKSFEIVAKVSPGFMVEINQMIRKIVPFDVSNGVHNSWSYTDVVGHLLMSYPTGMNYGEYALLEAILHEYNHNKLNLIMQTETLVLNDRRELYYSPYRPDARHIHGIYLWLHAIAWAYWVIWNAHASGILKLPEYWQRKSILYVLKNGLSLQVLDQYAQLSPLGRELLEEMRAVHKECLSYMKKANLKTDIITDAKKDLIEHFHGVQKKYPWVLS